MTVYKLETQLKSIFMRRGMPKLITKAWPDIDLAEYNENDNQPEKEPKP